MTRTKLLLTGLLAGAVAFGTACKTDKGTTDTTTNPGMDQTQMAPDSGTGGSTYTNPNEGREDVNPVPDESTRESEPGVHQQPNEEEPGTGGTGFEPQPLDRDNLGGENSSEPLSPGAPATSPDPQTRPMAPNGQNTPDMSH